VDSVHLEKNPDRLEDLEDLEELTEAGVKQRYKY